MRHDEGRYIGRGTITWDSDHAVRPYLREDVDTLTIIVMCIQGTDLDIVEHEPVVLGPYIDSPIDQIDVHDPSLDRMGWLDALCCCE